MSEKRKTGHSSGTGKHTAPEAFKFASIDHIIPKEKQKLTKQQGFHIHHETGRVIYHDKERDDHYITTTNEHGKTALDIQAKGGKIENHSSGAQRVYLKHNRHIFKSLL